MLSADILSEVAPVPDLAPLPAAAPPARPEPAALTAPVLLLLFNRPATTRAVFEAIRQARPTRLYLAADGPRPGHAQDAVNCPRARAVADEVDWPCEVKTLFQERNLNCGVGPATAISWFFEQEPEGIILEDDCLPHPDFFRFCQELLARYRHDTRVLHIGGNNFDPEPTPADPAAPSYFFSRQVNSWGWASWRRAWQLYDFGMRDLETLASRGQLRDAYPGPLAHRYWLAKFRGVRAAAATAPPDVWDYQWHFTIAAHSGLCIVPAVNLVGNIGFGQDATHTHDAADSFARAAPTGLPFPLRHPAYVLRDRTQDQRRFQRFLLGRVGAIARRWLTGFGRPASV